MKCTKKNCQGKRYNLILLILFDIFAICLNSILYHRKFFIIFYIAIKDSYTCSGGKVFSNCAPSCPKTCIPNMEQSCTGDCKPGCTCPEGLVEHKGKCIKQSTCPCFHNGKEYAEEKTITKDCNTWLVLFFSKST